MDMGLGRTAAGHPTNESCHKQYDEVHFHKIPFDYFGYSGWQ